MKNDKIKIDKLHKMDQPGGKRAGLWISLVLLVFIAAACFWYVNDYYHAEEYVNTYLRSTETVKVTMEEDVVFLDGSGTEHALIFYPGAKVEYTAYVPLFFRLAEQGIDCFLVKMPGNLAILGMNKAEEILEEYSYENWYLSGHSLGGAMAANFAADHAEELKGLVLLAAYPTTSLKESGLSVLSIYGSEDGVLNWKSLESGRGWMPADYTEVYLEGGNHAWFGYYGEQEGDGTAFITKENQQEKTVDVILDVLFK